MKKTLAAVGASVLGLAGALGASAAPASAVTGSSLPAKCTDATQHTVNPDVSPADAWYMTCVPQYGMGKAEFSLNAPEGGFPDGYSLTDGHQTVVSSTPTAAQVQSYFGTFYAQDHSSPVYTGAFQNLNLDTDASTPTSQQYDSPGDPENEMTAAFPITSVAALTTPLPAACSPDGETYDASYVINYAPTTTSFSELVGNKTYHATVTLTAPTLYLGLNFSGGELDSSRALCATSSLGTLVAPNESGFIDSTPLGEQEQSKAGMKAAALPSGLQWEIIAQDVATNDPGTLATVAPSTGPFTSIDGGAFDVTSAVVLAETGVDAAPAGILGGTLLAAGLASLIYVRRRKVASHRA